MIFEINGGPITHRYLMGKTKDQLAYRYLDLLKIHDEKTRELGAEIERLQSNLTAIEDEKNTYINYVGDALGQDYDGETLWDAAQRVLSERDRFRVRLNELRIAAQAALHYMRLHKYADQAWADDLEAALDQATIKQATEKT